MNPFHWPFAAFLPFAILTSGVVSYATLVILRRLRLTLRAQIVLMGVLCFLLGVVVTWNVGLVLQLVRGPA